MLALYSASPTEAEKAALRIADARTPLLPEKQTPALRLAIAIARNEYNTGSALSFCLERGIAFHHSSLSPLLRYLIEDQVRAETISFIAATTTLAQGMNFPVATVLIHSVYKPYGKGNLSPSEFWNIAGRAGRTGLVDQGLVIFAEKKHQSYFKAYSKALSQSVQSALLSILQQVDAFAPLKEQYRDHEELRPFLQYLAHAAAKESPTKAMANLEELIQASLANTQVKSSSDAKTLRDVARKYLETLSGHVAGYLKVSDTTGLGSFSFDELFAKIGDDPVLMAGPKEILNQKQEGLQHLIEVLKWLPELSLAIGFGEGQINVEVVARVIQGWMDGKSIPELATEFPGEDEADRIRKTARYIFSKVSQTVSWGAHAYLRGWSMRNAASADNLEPADAMLGAYIQYGVRTPEAAVASLLGVPRQFAEPFASEYRERHGKLTPQVAAQFKVFVESAETDLWRQVILRSSLANSIDPDDVRTT